MIGDDLLLISDYGRSGQGWLSYMLCYILNAKFIEPYDLLKGRIYSGSEQVLRLTQGDLPGRAKTSYSMIVKTHDFPAADFELYKKVIFLTRDPRDVAVSAFCRGKVLSAKSEPRSMRRRLRLMLSRHKLSSFLLTARGWRKHFYRWNEVPCLRIRYEDLSQDPKPNLQAILKYLQINHIDESVIDESISNFTFERIAGRSKGTEDPQNMEFRKGVVGDYKNYFNWFDKLVFQMICGDAATRAGYKF